MHGWSRTSCDDAFYNDMITACKQSGAQSRKRRHIEDFKPLLRHKFKRSQKAQEADDSFLFLWGSVCEMAAGMHRNISLEIYAYWRIGELCSLKVVHTLSYKPCGKLLCNHFRAVSLVCKATKIFSFYPTMPAKSLGTLPMNYAIDEL